MSDRPYNHFFQGKLAAEEYRFFQIAWVVDDLMETLNKWVDVFGHGPFQVLPKRTSRVLYRGEETDLELQIAVTQCGPVQLEFIEQSSDTKSVYREIFPQGSGGVHHMCTISPDLDRTRAHYAAKGYEPIAEIIGGPMQVLYFDTFADFGFITEVVEHDDQFLTFLKATADVCADWDGKDPIRLLRRGGYDVPK